MSRPRFCLLILAGLLPLVLTGCAGFIFSMGHWNDPPGPKSRRDIAQASTKNPEIRLRELDLEAYPALNKFHKLRGVDYHAGWARLPDGATDEKLEALANVGFTNLHWINVYKSPLVTDRGIAALCRIPSLTNLQFEGTSITDRGLETLGAKSRLQAVGLHNCSNLTARGLVALLRSKSLTRVSFSCENLAEADMIDILDVEAAAKKNRIDLRIR